MRSPRLASLVLTLIAFSLLSAEEEAVPPDGPIAMVDSVEVRGLESVETASDGLCFGVPKDALLVKKARYFLQVPFAEIEGLKIAGFEVSGKYCRGGKDYELTGEWSSTRLSGWTQSKTGRWKPGELRGQSKALWIEVRPAFSPAVDAPRVAAKITLADKTTLLLHNPAMGKHYAEREKTILDVKSWAYTLRMDKKLSSFQFDSISSIKRSAEGGKWEFTIREGATRELWCPDHLGWFLTGESDEGLAYVVLRDLRSIEFENEADVENCDKCWRSKIKG